MSESSAGLTPVQPTQRIVAVDILRGFTLLGILVANMAVFGGFSQGPSYWTDPVDKTAQLLILFLAVGEFYVPFSFLFGWGLAVQMERAAARGVSALPLALRRVLVLLIIGLAHAILVWNGDVLVIYALLSLPLLLCRRLPDRALLALAVVCLFLTTLIATPGPAADFIQSYNQAVAGLRQEAVAGQQAGVYVKGDYPAMVAQRVKELKSYYTGAIYWGLYIFGLFLLGLVAGRKRILQDIAAHLPLFRRLLWVGLLVGLPLTAVYVLTSLSPDAVPADWQPFVRRASRVLGGLGLCCLYLSAIVLLVQKESWQKRLAFLAPVGRMTLTNYLMQSVVCTLIFYGYGLALYNRVGPAIGLIFSVLIFAAQVKFSDWWLDRYRFGPMEWLWRSLTYLKPQPMRLEDTGEARLNRRTVLALAAVALLAGGAVAGAGGWWWLNHRDNPPPVVVQLPQLQPTARPSATPQATFTPQPTPIGTPVVAPVVRTPGPAAAQGDIERLGSSFDAEHAFEEIEALADPAYAGRAAGSPGGRGAGDYLAQRFAEYGLQPAGTGGSYFQPFPVVYTTLSETPDLTIIGPDGTTHEYRSRQDYSVSVGHYAGSGTAEGPMVWVNDGLHDDYNAIDVTGKIVLCRELGGGQEDRVRNALEHGATGLLLLADTDQRPLDRIGPYREVWVPAPIPVFRVAPPVAQDLLAGTGLTLNDLTIRFTALPLSTTARLEVSLRTDQDAQGRNVLGVLPGRDPAYAGDLVIVGAHYDHMGQDPDGTTWVGANDDASGVAVLLEIARSWREQGYVPRRTVLFAAWDAEELGLVGSAYYVTHPSYPLTGTVAMLQLDMVGTGGDSLSIEGSGALNPELQAIAQTLGFTATTSTNVSGSDHVPFVQAHVPAAMLIWFMGNGATPDYHRPSDTPAVIEPDKLAGAGRITDLALLALVEGEPTIQDLLQARAAAVRRGDATAFLRTSTTARQEADRSQFDALRAVSPMRFDLTAADMQVVGRVATTTMQMDVQYISTASTKPVTVTSSARLPVRLVYQGDTGWQWDGPALTWEPAPPTGSADFAVAYPPGQRLDPDLGRLTAARYAQVATTLGLPPTVRAAVLFYPTDQALWADTTFPQSTDAATWVGPAPGSASDLYYVKLVAGSAVPTDTLVHLALARAGVSEAEAPWLWRGLPLALDAETDPVAAQSGYLPELVPGLAAADATMPRDVADWAAVDYLRRRVGWEGIGRLIVAIGQGQSPNEALTAAIGTDTAGFETTWRADWRNRLAQAQTGLDALLSARQKAVLARDEVAFRNTIDPADPILPWEEYTWFADLEAHPVDSFELEGQPLALLDDGRLLAQVTMRYHFLKPEDQGHEAPLSFAILMTPDGAGYRWAGPPFETLQGEHVIVRYPAGQEQAAREVLTDTEVAYVQVVSDLQTTYPTSPTVKLYSNAQAFRASTILSLPNGVENWTGPWGAIRWLLRSGQSPVERRRALTRGLALQLSLYMGVEPGQSSLSYPHLDPVHMFPYESYKRWLYEGLALVESSRLPALTGRPTSQTDGQEIAALYEPLVVRGAQRKRLVPLGPMPPFTSLAGDELELARAESWDAARYLADTYGWDKLRALLRTLPSAEVLDEAFRPVLGLSLVDFEAAWQASAARGHAKPEWVPVAAQFDPAAANAHVTELASPAYAGRQAGSPGDRAAAQYIADRFANYGLTPAGDAGTYFQHIPISYTAMLTTPRLLLLNPGGSPVSELTYREHFLPRMGGGAGGGTVEGELVWVRGDYGEMRLAGKIVLRRLAGSDPAQEVQAAINYGAGGLILVGDRKGKSLLAQEPLPVSFPSPLSPPIGGAGGGIPVAEVTEVGLGRLLAAGTHSLAELSNSPPALPLGQRVRLEVPLSPAVPVSTTNVLGFVPGSDPVLRQEVVVVGAHYDHVGDAPDGLRYPGANDDASGVGVMLEVARLWQATGYRPARSVLFAAWGAQEAGEVGSRFYVMHPAFPPTDTVVMFELDAVGGGVNGYRLQGQGSALKDKLLLADLETAADLADGRFVEGKPGGQGDQQPFQQAGVPAVLLTWINASEENLPVDLADEVDPYKLGVTGRTVALVLMMLAR